jgi:hypothetical protein
VALDQYAIVDQAGDGLAHGHARQRQPLRQLALARQHLARLQVAALERGEHGLAQAHVAQRPRTVLPAEAAVLGNQVGGHAKKHTTQIPDKTILAEYP